MTEPVDLDALEQLAKDACDVYASNWPGNAEEQAEANSILPMIRAAIGELRDWRRRPINIDNRDLEALWGGLVQGCADGKLDKRDVVNLRAAFTELEHLRAWKARLGPPNGWFKSLEQLGDDCGQSDCFDQASDEEHEELKATFEEEGADPNTACPNCVLIWEARALLARAKKPPC